MININYSYSELEKKILESNYFGEGKNGVLLQSNDWLIKINRAFYYNIINGNFSLNEIIVNYQNIVYDKINVAQIEYLANRQSRITNSKLPLGIISLNDMPIAIISYFHRNYKNLDQMKFSNWEQKLIIDSVYENLVELDRNLIYYLDVSKANVLYNRQNVQLTDFDGSYVIFDMKSDYIKSMMYSNFASFVISLVKEKEINTDKIDVSEINGEKEAYQLVKRVNKML